MMTASYTDHRGATVEVEVHGLGENFDSWDKRAGDGCCEAMQDGSRTTWFLCRKPAKAIAVERDGRGRYVCGTHVGFAKRARRLYADTVIALLTLDGTQTHEWTATSIGRGYLDER